MGKKKRGASKQVAGAVPSPQQGRSKQRLVANSVVSGLVDDLWKLLQENHYEQLKFLLDEYDKIQIIICKLRGVQGCSLAKPERISGLSDLETWLHLHGAVYEGVEITECPNLGFGLQTKRELKCDEKALVIPRKVMMTSETALDGSLGVLISRDHMLQTMPNVALALHLLNEKHCLDSFWKPYIDVLPHSFSLPLYFSKDELMILRGSPSLVKSLIQVRNITKLYAHLHMLIRAKADISLPLYKSGFIYDDFIWAVSCVMSRQNEIPSASLPTSSLALIPMWDFCNHSSGHITTFFNVDIQTCDCYAQQDCSAGEEFTIFYGPRTNSELLLQQGFVYPRNEFDSLEVKLGLSSGEDDRTRALRTKVLEMLNIPIPSVFSIPHSKENHFTPELRAFARVYTASSELLQELVGEDSAKISLKEKWQYGDNKALEFLEKRFLLLLMMYPTPSMEEDQLLLKNSQSFCVSQAIELRMSEKRILVEAGQYAKFKLEELDREHSKQSMEATNDEL